MSSKMNGPVKLLEYAMAPMRITSSGANQRAELE
jgi:hypothetical protein